MPVHLYGHPADMPAIVEIATRHGAAVIEDAAQAHGASVGDRHVGTYGLGCFSFYATKAVTSGEGGIVITDDDDLADRMRVLRNQGMSATYVYESPGHNLRLSDVQAAIAVPQLDRVLEQNERRRRTAARLTESLKDIRGLRTPLVAAGRTSSFHQYTVAVTADAPLSRDSTLGALTARGIGCRVYYPRVVYDYDCYRSHPGVVVEPMPRAERAAAEVLSLPVHPWLSDADVQRIVAAVQEVLGG
jgi:perosamine synthetase